MWWLFAACVSSLLFSTVTFGTFVPLKNAGGIEYLFAGPGAATLVTAWLPAVICLTIAFVGIQALSRRQSPEHLSEARSGRWLAPLSALGVVALGILPAVPGVGEHGAVVAYFLYDLRWWWAALLTVLVCVRADRLVGAPLGRRATAVARWSAASRLLLLDSTLFVGVVAWAVLTTPLLRFDNGLHGDEPKYVRYCELWYQGEGLDISRLTLVSDEPVDERPALFQNIARFIETVPQEARALVQDLREFAHHPFTFRWNRVRGGNGFVAGKHGGVYQKHEPGVGMVLCPGYFVDRYLLTVDSTGDGKFPSDFPMTNVMMLLTYGACAVALFRLLRNALESEALAWTWAAMGMLTLPVTAFAFQLYPELPVLCIVLIVSNTLFFSDGLNPATAAFAGAATGALAWFHPRFLLISLFLAVVAWLRRAGPARWAFVASFAALVLSMMGFNYHVTGSWLPTALWDADGEGVDFLRVGFVLNVIGYAVDRTWGLLPHALILLGAVPGLLVMARKSIEQAVFVAVMVLALTVTAAGHTLTAAQGTPGRLVLSVVPLLMWPIAVLVRRFWGSDVMRLVTVVLGVLSLDAALAYNWSHSKPEGPLRDVSLSGWKPNLAFPVIRGELWNSSRANFVLFVCVTLLILALSVLAFWKSARSPRARPTAMRHAWVVFATVLVMLVGSFTAATSADGDWTSSRYLLDATTARNDAMNAVVMLDPCRMCFSSERRRIDWKALAPNSARGAHIGVYREGGPLGVTVHVLVDGDPNVPAFGRMLVDYGDGHVTPWTGVIGERRVRHTYAHVGTYAVNVWFRSPFALDLYKATAEVRSGE